MDIQLTPSQLTLLRDIATAAAASTFIYAKPTHPMYAQLAAKGVIEYNPGMVDENGRHPFRPTAAGVNYLNAQGNTMTDQTTDAPSFAIVSVPLPPITRNVERESRYPFKLLQEGQSFFEPMNGRKSLPKSLGSTAGTLSKQGEAQFTTRVLDDGSPWDEKFKGVKGVAVFRLTAEQIAERDERAAKRAAAKAAAEAGAAE